MIEPLIPSQPTIEAIAGVIGKLKATDEKSLDEKLLEVAAALGTAAARILAALATSTDNLQEALTWFGEQVERDALSSFHYRKSGKPEDFR